VTLFDTSVVIDARDSGSRFHIWAKEQIAEAVAGEGAAVDSVVLAEASVRAKAPEDVPTLLERFGMTLLPLPISASVPAAKAFALYLERLAKEGKRPLSRMLLPDFLIGAHAESEAMKLVTRDPERVRTYFPKVRLIVP